MHGFANSLHQKLVHNSVPRYIPNAHPSLVPPLPRRGLYVFTKGLKKLTADLEAVDDESAVVQRYEDALVAKQEVRYDLLSDLGPSCSYISKFARLLETLEKKEKGDREAALTAARNGRIDQ